MNCNVTIWIFRIILCC